MKSRKWYQVVFDWFVEDRWIAPEERDIRGGPVPYRVLTHAMTSNKASMKDTNTPAVHIVRSHLDLPSNIDHPSEKALTDEDGNVSYGTAALATGSLDVRPEQALWKSLDFLTKFKPAELVTWVFGLLPLINKFFIFVSTWLEFGVRTIGNLFNYPLHKVRRFLLDEHSTPSKIAVGVFGGILSIPFWAVSQVLTLASDVLSYARTCLDAITNLFIIPMSHLTTRPFGDTNNYPEFLPTLWKATKSFLQLIPAAFLITAAVLTAGASVTLQSGFAAAFNFISTAVHPLATTLAAVLHPLVVATKVVVASLILGLAAAVSKKLSSYVTRFDHYLEERKIKKAEEKLNKEKEQTAREERQQAKQKRMKSKEESSHKSDDVELTATTEKNKSMSSTSQIEDSLEIDPAMTSSSEEVTYVPPRRMSESVSVVRLHGFTKVDQTTTKHDKDKSPDQERSNQPKKII